MNSLVHRYRVPMDDFEFNYHSKPDFPRTNSFKPPPTFDESSSSEGEISQDCYVPTPEISVEPEDPNITLNFISEMLMEDEDLDKQLCEHDSLSLQATEKSLYDVLHNNPHENANSISSTQSSGVSQAGGLIVKVFEQIVEDENLRRGKKSLFRQDGNFIEEVQRNNKQLASNDVGVEYEPLELLYDDALLCIELNRMIPSCHEASRPEPVKQPNRSKKSNGLSNRGRPRKIIENVYKEVVVVDLRSLLLQCAQAVASNDIRTINDLLVRIRKHSSPHGDANERVAHFFADALEARVAGIGAVSYTGFISKRISASEMLKAFVSFIKGCPFRKIWNVMANRTIYKLVLESKATTVHVIDFGILFGYQWPCLIKRLSLTPGGPPKLRITGIDFPLPGFRPAERVADTGIRLKKYCERFGVPFEYHGIAQKWETIKIEHLKIEKNELLVANSLYWLHNMPDDETMTDSSPRNDVIDLIKKINPRIFVHGTVDGKFNTPFFFMRFREALFHYSSMFDMFEATVFHEEKHRLMYEKEIFGWGIMNTIACEGIDRIERPETYKQWQFRYKRVGFEQLDLDQEILKFVRRNVRIGYNKDYSVDEDGSWMLQGWKGRVNHVMSFWRPANK